MSAYLEPLRHEALESIAKTVGNFYTQIFFFIFSSKEQYI